MAYTSQSETIAGGVALTVSWTMLLLRLVQQILSSGRFRKFAHANARPPTVSEWIGTAFFILSASILACIFALRLSVVMQKAKAGASPSDEVITNTLHFNDIVAILAPTSTWALKGSYLCIFWGMLSVMRRGMRISLICVSIYMVVSYFVVLGVDLGWCKPLSSMWTFDGTYNTCNTIAFWDVTPFNIKFAMTLSTDLAILMFTLFLLRPSEARQQRMDLRAVAFIIFIGCLSILSIIARDIYNRLLVTHQSSAGSLKTQYNHGFNVFQCLELLFATLAYGLTFARQQFRLFSSVLAKRFPFIAKWGKISSPLINNGTFDQEKAEGSSPSGGKSSPGEASMPDFPELSLSPA